GGNGGAGGAFNITGGNAHFSSTSSLNLSGGTGGAFGSGGGPATDGVVGAAGTLTLSDGTLRLPSVGWLESDATFMGNFAFTGGTLQATVSAETLSLDGASVLGQALADPAVTAARTLDLAGNLTLSGVIAGSGSLTKAGSGNLTLSGTNTLSGG